MKKTMKRLSFKSGLLSLMALCSMALTIGSCANDDVAQNPTMPNDDKNLELIQQLFPEILDYSKLHVQFLKLYMQF